MKKLNENQMQSVCGGMPAGLINNPGASHGVILAIGVALPTLNLSIIIIADTVINAPLAINVGQGIHRG